MPASHKEKELVTKECFRSVELSLRSRALGSVFYLFGGVVGVTLVIEGQSYFI